MDEIQSCTKKPQKCYLNGDEIGERKRLVHGLGIGAFIFDDFEDASSVTVIVRDGIIANKVHSAAVAEIVCNLEQALVCLSGASTLLNMYWNQLVLEMGDG